MTLVANAQAELAEARARVAGTAWQFQALFEGIDEAALVLDADLRLVEWHQHFPALLSIAPAVLQPGMSLEELLRIQAGQGAFGTLDDTADEVARRLEQLRRDTATIRSMPAPADVRWPCSPVDMTMAACC